MQLEPYLTKFQTNKPLFPFLYHDIYNMLHDLMTWFVKPDITKGVINASKLLGVEFTKADNLKTLHSTDIGFAASSVCKNSTSQMDELKFREECRTCSIFVTKLVAKCPLQYSFVKGVTCLDPEVMMNADLRRS
jgi:hypothetical protein